MKFESKKNLFFIYFLLITVLFLGSFLFVQVVQAFDLSLYSGSTVHARTPIKLSQKGKSEIKFNAEHETRPFDTPLFFHVRLAHKFSDQEGFWALSLMHDKIHIISKPPSEVQYFTIIDGFNLLMLEYFKPIFHYLFSLSAGVSVVHPETEVRNKIKGRSGDWSGYYLGGPVLGASLLKRLYFNKSEVLWLDLETGFRTSYSWFPIAEGTGEIFYNAVYFLVGLGFKIK